MPKFISVMLTIVRLGRFLLTLSSMISSVKLPARLIILANTKANLSFCTLGEISKTPPKTHPRHSAILLVLKLTKKLPSSCDK
jgi:hypothetical protein